MLPLLARTMCIGMALILSTGAALAQSAASIPERIHLWGNGAPGFEDRASIPEISREYWTRNINNPSVTYYPAREERRTGAAVIIMPGGAHEFLVITSEGDDTARWFAERGIAAFVLRYRLARGKDSPIYTFDHARQDATRAVQLVRSRASAYSINPERIGVVGFSAGGELARAAAVSPYPAPVGSSDPVDRISPRPDFGILIYPGPMHGPENITKDGPPLLLVAANDDACCSQPAIDLMQAYRRAGASAELHLYAGGGHAFNMGQRTPFTSLRHWPDRITDWMSDRGWLSVTAPPAAGAPAIGPDPK